MAKLEFKDLEFLSNDDYIRVYFLNNYFFDIEKSELKRIGKFSVHKKSIEFSVQLNKAEKGFNKLLNQGFANLTNLNSKKKTIYIHRNLAIPLIGLNYFGLVDRNTNLIEVKPITTCNFNCIYCSIDQGLSSKRAIEFVIEKEFLVEELKKLIDTKDSNNIEIYINPHGEPLLYKPIIELISDISKIDKVRTIAIATNGILLDKKMVDDLIKAGLNKFNISVNAITPKTAKIMAGVNYLPEQILNICKYIKSKDVQLFIAPVFLRGYNESELPKLIEFAKSVDAKLCIQNFLNYRFGRNPIKAVPFDKFFIMMKDLEKKHNVKLIVDADDFKISKTNELKKPFKKGDIVDAQIVFIGSLPGEKIAFCEKRLISVPNCKKSGKIRLKIVRSKHNIFVGVVV